MLLFTVIISITLAGRLRGVKASGVFGVLAGAFLEGFLYIDTSSCLAKLQG